MHSAAVLLLCLSSPAIGDDRDTVHLTKGRPVRGRVVLELKDRVAIQVGSRERWIPRSKIARIESVARNHREMLSLLRDNWARTEALLEALGVGGHDEL